MNRITIIMYHYVRNKKLHRFRNIKALDISEFKNQLNYLIKNFNFISMEDLIEHVHFNKDLPQNSALLTFDDGYKDHFDNVLPILMEFNLKGSFFVPIENIQNNTLLDVNKLHLILASSEIETIYKLFLETVSSKLILDLPQSIEFYKNKFLKPGRFDDQYTSFIKSMLQFGLPEDVRKKIIDLLFIELLNTPEEILSNELYMTIDQLKFMKKSGMHIGLHGFSHIWLGKASIELQLSEIQKSFNYLKSNRLINNLWSMCYPYGSYNSDTLKILAEMGCSLAFTTNVNHYNVNNHHYLEIPRFDTNDFPK